MPLCSAPLYLLTPMLYALYAPYVGMVIGVCPLCGVVTTIQTGSIPEDQMSHCDQVIIILYRYSALRQVWNQGSGRLTAILSP